MSKLRNPFRMRASEKIESPENFIRLYESTILNILIDKNNSGVLWDNIVYINSSPGGGKTSLLRVFEPKSLATIQGNRSVYKSFHNQLKKLEVVDDKSIKLLGVSLLCTRNYETLEDLDISAGQKTRFFFSLLNARVVIATLRSIIQLKGLSFPEDLSKIEFNYTDVENFFLGNTPKNGKQLYEWASQVERSIYKKLDSFIPVTEESQGHNELFSFSILKPDYFFLDGKMICNRILFMLDDTHKLSENQKDKFKRYLIEKRGNFSLWVSQRLEALSPQENLGSFEGRDYEVINLERFWSEKSTRFKNSLINIANARAGISTDNVTSFSEYIQENLNEDNLKEILTESISSSEQKIMEMTAHTTKFDDWIEHLHSLEGQETPLELAIHFRKTEILIARQLRKSQLSFDFPLEKSDLIEALDSADTTPAARLFLSENEEIPYYYGVDKLIDLSSHNIEQFLNFSSDLYEEMLSNKVLGNSISIRPNRQEEIIRQIVDKKWQELPKIIPYATDVTTFLSKVGEFCHEQTYQPNAPYTPGVNGISIKLNKNQLSILPEGNKWWKNDNYKRLANVVSTCISYNLLEARITKQGAKNAEWTVYYLNKWLCVKFSLPFGYGGFRHKNANELMKWF